MSNKRPPVRVMDRGHGLVLGWVDPIEEQPPKPAPDPATRSEVLPPIRCTSKQKAAWERKAKRAKKSLSDWIRTTLDEA